jgi:hypothetical protein
MKIAALQAKLSIDRRAAMKAGRFKVFSTTVW